MKKTENNVTELVFILDRSGSMAGLESDTIGGFNSLIEKQKSMDGECFVTTVLFDNVVETVHDRVRLADIEPMTEKEYFVRGCTALIDAIGSTVEHIDTIHKYARPEDVPEHTIFVIVTDGLENDSREYDKATVKSMIEATTNDYHWNYIFMGANIDSVAEAGALGIRADHAMNYSHDSEGVQESFSRMNEAAKEARESGNVDGNWKTGQ